MKFVFKILCLFLICILNSCMQIDCEKSATSQRENYDIEIILTEPPYGRGSFNLKGKDIYTNKIKNIEIQSRWYWQFKDVMEIADTVIKRKGELTLYIHKKDTVMTFKWECQGKIYE